MRSLISLLCVFILACATPQRLQSDFNNYQIPIDTSWNMYVFDVESSFAYGRAFIADNEIWSARHIFVEQDPGIENDIMDLGHSDLPGLTLCKNEHKLNDIFYYRTRKGLKFLMLVHIEDGFYGVLPLSPLERGDSGSPVMCIKDGKVIGIVSHLIETPNGTCVGGEIARIKLHTSD